MPGDQSNGNFQIRVEDSGLIFVRITGRPSIDSAADFNAQMMTATRSLNGSLHLLFDVSQGLPASAAARHHVMDVLRHLPIERLAILGATPVIRAITKAVFHYIKLDSQVRYFENESVARSWLLERPPPPHA